MDFMLLGLAILPVIVLMIYIYRQDKYQKEPVKLLIRAFIGGILAIPLDYLVVDIINSIYYSGTVFYSAFFEAGLPEELCKFAFLFLLIWRRKEFDEYMDGIVYAVFVGLGFACVENIMYVFNYGVSTGIVRAVLSVPGHFLFAVIMGYFFSLAKFDKKNRAVNLLLSIGCAALAHGLFDWLLMIQEFLTPAIATLVYIVFIWGDIKLWKLGIKFIRKQQQLTQNQPFASDDKFAQAEVPETETVEPEYKHIDWNAGKKNQD